MNIQGYPDELDYVNAKMRPRDQAGIVQGPQSFLSTFLSACLRADAENYEVLRPALRFFMTKYPADPRALAAEKS